MPRPLPSRSPVLGALASAAAASLLLAAPAAAAPLPRLVVHRAPAAADCPDAAALAAAVERQMQRPALDPASADRFAPLFEVQILRSDEGYTAILQAGGRARQIADPGPTCAGLAEALAITLAILLDSELPANRAPPPPQPPPQPPPRPPPQPPPLPPEPPRKRWDVSIDAGAALTTGLLTPLSGALVADVSLRLRGGSFGAGVVWLPPRTIDFAPGTVDVWLAVATVRGCAAVLGAALEGPRLSLCGQPMLGAIHGEGQGYTPDREGTVPWFALAAAALGEGPIAGPLGWSARAMLVVPVTQESFTVDRRQGDQIQPAVAFDPSPVGLLVGIGARLTIP